MLEILAPELEVTQQRRDSSHQQGEWALDDGGSTGTSVGPWLHRCMDADVFVNQGGFMLMYS